MLSGCATPQHDGRERLVLERPGDVIHQSLTGRFVIRVQLPGTDEEKGGQGKFEWLDFGSREVLMLLGPLGQSAGTIELSQHMLKTFNDRGRRLDDEEQLQLLRGWLGHQAVDGLTPAQIHNGLTGILHSFRRLRDVVPQGSPPARHDTVLVFGAATVSLRIAPDPAE